MNFECLSMEEVMQIEGGFSLSKFVDGCLQVVESVAQGVTGNLYSGRNNFEEGCKKIAKSFK